MEYIALTFWEFIGIACLIAFPLTLLVIILFAGGKPLRTIIRAKIRRTPLLLVVRRTGVLDFLTGQTRSGLVDTKDGYYFFTPNAHYITPNKLKAGIFFEDYAVSLPKDFIVSTEQLRAVGIKSYTDLVAWSEQAEAEQKALLEKLEKEAKSKKKKLEELLANIRLPEWITVVPSHAVQSVLNFFKYNVNPKLIRAKIAEATADVAEEYKKSEVVKWILVIGVFLVLVAFAYWIISTAASSGVLEEVKTILKQTQSAVKSARVITQNATAATVVK